MSLPDLFWRPCWRHGVRKHDKPSRTNPVVTQRGDNVSKGTQGIDELSFSQKLSRLRIRLRNARWRRYGMLLLAGKALGIVAALRADHHRDVNGPLGMGVDEHHRRPCSGDRAGFANRRRRQPRIRTRPRRAATSSTRSTPAGFCSARSSCSACRRASPCSRPASVEIVKPSTCWSNACSTPASAAFCTGDGASRSCSAGATPSSAGIMPGDPSKSLIFMKDVSVIDDLRRHGHPDPGALSLPVRLRRLRFDDLLGRDGRPHPVRGRRPLFHRRLGLHLSDLRPLVLGSRWLPRHDGLAGRFPVESRNELPRLRGFNRCALDRRMGRDRRRHHAWAQAGSQVQA